MSAHSWNAFYGFQDQVGEVQSSYTLWAQVSTPRDGSLSFAALPARAKRPTFTVDYLYGFAPTAHSFKLYAEQPSDLVVTAHCARIATVLPTWNVENGKTSTVEQTQIVALVRY